MIIGRHLRPGEKKIKSGHLIVSLRHVLKVLRLCIILKETLICSADCTENQAQDVIFICDRFAKEIKYAVLICLLCQNQP